MKECGLKLMARVACSSLPEGECLGLNNEGIGGGKVSGLSESLIDESDQSLVWYLEMYSAGGKYVGKCKASGVIAAAAVAELERRKNG